MKINFNACTLENSSDIFFSVSGKLPPAKFQSGKFPPIKLPPDNLSSGKFSARKLPPGIFPPMFLDIPTQVFFFFFFSLLPTLSLILLKRLFFNYMFWKCWSLYVVNICQNEGLSEERQLMKWVGIFQVRIFWVAFFQGGGVSSGEFDVWEFLGWGFPREEFS